MKRVAIYVRVSTDGQTVSNQEQELRTAADRNGWEIVQVFADEGISGAKGRDQRPAFDKLCTAMARKQFDMVAAWAVDRLGRSLQHLVGFLTELRNAGCDLYLHQQGLDTSTPAGRAMFGMLAIFGEFEREMIRERVNAGLARAKREGKALGMQNPARVAACRETAMKGAAAMRAAACQRAAVVLPIIASIRKAGVETAEGIAEALAARGIKTARGGSWSGVQVQRVLARAES